MTARTTSSPSSAMIRATFDMMLREWRHRPSAVRFTCEDLGVQRERVLDALSLEPPFRGGPVLITRNYARNGSPSRGRVQPCTHA